MNSIIKFNQAIDGLSTKLKSYLSKLPIELKSNAKEIRIRSGRPLSIYTGEYEVFINEYGRYTHNYISGGIIIKSEDIKECFKTLCGYSVHTYQNEICNGYITINGGHRAGICGTAVVDNGKIINIRDISSINLRIAREHIGCSKPLIDSAYKNEVCGLLIVGCPLSGKTTLLKDLVCQLSSGMAGEYKKVAVVDERGELSAMLNGMPQNNIGICCDVLDGYPKNLGMGIAIRTMSPQIVVIDEIGDEQDAYSIESCLNAGVIVIATVHANSVSELARRKHIMHAINTGAFKKIVFLNGSATPTKIHSVLTLEELYNAIARSNSNSRNYDLSGNYCIKEPISKSN